MQMSNKYILQKEFYDIFYGVSAEIIKSLSSCFLFLILVNIGHCPELPF